MDLTLEPRIFKQISNHWCHTPGSGCGGAERKTILYKVQYLHNFIVLMMFILVRLLRSYLNSFKHLGHIVNSKMTDDKDVERQRRALCVVGNMITRKFNSANYV